VSRVVITAAETVCALGGDLDTCLQAWRDGRSGLVPEDGRLVGRIADRRPLKGRRYGAASNLAVHVARRAVERAGWSPEQTASAWLFAASSRGNAGELLGAHAWRRPSRRFSASNTMHSEIAAAASIEIGLRGPWQLLSNGCSSGLDALGLAWMALKAGVARRALVLAVDLPLLPELLRDFADTRLLARSERNDPLAPATAGFQPGEAGVALTLELDLDGWAEVTDYRANSDAHDSLMVPEDGRGLAELLQGLPAPALICPHATGTPNHATAEVAALRTAFGDRLPPLLLLKPFTGHSLGASGLLDTALLAAAMGQPPLPGNLPGLTCPTGITLPATPISMPKDSTILKIASGMGGHNAAVGLRG
jgi:3-oxoacyl-[acyl-carrier-protein] synthase II